LLFPHNAFYKQKYRMIWKCLKKCLFHIDRTYWNFKHIAMLVHIICFLITYTLLLLFVYRLCRSCTTIARIQIKCYILRSIVFNRHICVRFMWISTNICVSNVRYFPLNFDIQFRNVCAQFVKKLCSFVSRFVYDFRHLLLYKLLKLCKWLALRVLYICESYVKQIFNVTILLYIFYVHLLHEF
jgi:hypothetical protein